jgi:2-polyprenyl-6-hydroxyphenyl methylase / 3-demethylubiquinone-9 3-methyltransferase
LIALKGVEWFVRNTPKHLHVYSMFIRPRELQSMCEQAGMQTHAWTGLRPQLNAGFFRMLRTGIVDSEFIFKGTRSRAISYLGSAFKH